MKEKTPQKWHKVYNNDEEKRLFVGKDGDSGLIRAKDKDGKHYDWRSTDALARESGLSKKRTEEILDYYWKMDVVRQHPKDPEKWGYWENVGAVKEDVDPIEKDHQDRLDKAKKLTPSMKTTNPTQAVGQFKPTTSTPTPVGSPSPGTNGTPTPQGGSGKILVPKKIGLKKIGTKTADPGKATKQKPAVAATP